MYVPNNQITFTLNRSKQASPLTPASIRVIKPDNDVVAATISVGGNTFQPNSTTDGKLTFTYTPDLVGLYRFEVIATVSGVNELMHVLLVGVVSEDTVYTSSMTN